MRIIVTIDVPDTPDDDRATSAPALMNMAIDAENRSLNTSPEDEIAQCLAARLEEFYVGGACVVIDPNNVTIRIEP